MDGAKIICVAGLELKLEFLSGSSAFDLDHQTETLAPGVDVVSLTLSSSETHVPSPLFIKWSQPCVDVQVTWTTSSGRNKGLAVDWGRAFQSNACSGAPVVCLLNNAGQNRLTFAVSEVLQTVQLQACIHEESGEFLCGAALFTDPPPATNHYTFQLRIDRRDIPYSKSLNEVAAWWSTLLGCSPAFVPEAGRLPVYSTWYSFHQKVDPIDVEEQCRLARELGCGTLIMDDGWQTLDSQRGYAFCGDWKPERIPGMKTHVARVHTLGMKYLLWYSVPFVGFQSEASRRFQGKFLSSDDRKQTHVLDPRFPDVRDYLIQTYAQAMQEWDLDGFKLDFVDAFAFGEKSPREAIKGRDIASLPEAVDRLLEDILICLQKIKAEVMIEFRQSYTGPLMRKVGNMLRVGDCPNDSQANRIGVCDLRLLAGYTAVHSDMLMWHPDEPVETAALQLLNILFSVPQLSVRLNQLPPAHLKMIRFWLHFWREHRDCLLEGTFLPLQPQDNYPLVIAKTTEKWIAVTYSQTLIPLTDKVAEYFIINATGKDYIVLEVLSDMNLYTCSILDCQGNTMGKRLKPLCAGLHKIKVPPSGLIQIK